MLIKRHYDAKQVAKFKAAVAALEAQGLSHDAAMSAVEKPPVTHLEVKHTGSTPAQNFSTSLVADGAKSGLITVDGDKLTVHAKPANLVYQIKRKPGYYCCHDGKALELTPAAYGDPALAAVEAQAYLKKHKFEGKTSPDPRNPSGYERVHQFECVLDDAAHARFKAKPGPLAMSMKQGA